MHLAPGAHQPRHFKVFCSKRRFHFIYMTSPNASNPLTQRCQTLKTEGQNFSEMAASTYSQTQPAHLPEVDMKRVESQVGDCLPAPCPPLKSLLHPEIQGCVSHCVLCDLPALPLPVSPEQTGEGKWPWNAEEKPHHCLLCLGASSHMPKLNTSFASCELATRTVDSPSPFPPNSPKFNDCTLVYWLPHELMFLHKILAIPPHPKADRT